ncbi:DNA-3-methyladenine glycosylase I [Pararhodospirillum photometricum]|uniref:DNA-3-methyladenine glycosylase I n=1 Tax=Pararhodospirillum photometricum DSM 122 TaxID=1150469 RepID=H6SNK8_PARPM|nr:DNA-3-methyladenine glycosylase I [Pararhodospirillum photometricum]CCG09339.1 DNA-3-methyladenine glycosylase I [Pararhodospirillum photometricum DSM 122]
MSAYCDSAPGHPLHGPYHDTEYGVPQTDETVLFERLCLEIFQAGLSWELILKRRAGLGEALAGFDVDTLAGWGEADVERLVTDPRLIRNRRKIAALLENARRVQALRLSHGHFAGWIRAHHPLPLADWVRLFRRTFLFTGPEVVNEFLMSLGVLPGAHRDDCPVARHLATLPSPWET